MGVNCVVSGGWVGGGEAGTDTTNCCVMLMLFVCTGAGMVVWRPCPGQLER